jgi:hypothetical protein
MFNKILAVSNLDSIEFNWNNDYTGSGTVINRFCTSTDVANTSYAYSDNHVISSLGVKNIIAAKSTEFEAQIAAVDNTAEVNEIQEWIENHPSPESKIEGPECDVVCGDQTIGLEI